MDEDAPLDMRMDRTGGKTARDIVNGYSREELYRVIHTYGEERFANNNCETYCGGAGKTSD